MSSPLKNVPVQDIEKAIAETLTELCSEAKGLTVDIEEMQFIASTGRVSISLTASRKLDSFEEVFGAS